MPEQLPDGFSRKESSPSSALYDQYGRKLKDVPTIGRKERDAFANSGVEYDGFAAADRLHAAQAEMDESILKSMEKMNPEIRRMIDPITAEDED
jgi:hypothetical protein